MEEDKQNLETTIERFNKEFQRLERNIEKVLNRYKKVSEFVTHQRNLFIK